MAEAQTAAGEELISAFIAVHTAKTIARDNDAYNTNRGNPELEKVTDRLTQGSPESLNDINDEFARFIGLEVLTAIYNDAREKERLAGLVTEAKEASEELWRIRDALVGQAIIVTAIDDDARRRGALSYRKRWSPGDMMSGAKITPNAARGVLSKLSTSDRTFSIERHRPDRATGLEQYVTVEPFYVPDTTKPLEIVRNVTIELDDREWK